jgi:peptide/nickel transport system substrate-binding protein
VTARRAAAVAGLVALLVVLPAAPAAPPSPLRGGTYRVGWEAVYDWTTDDFDPTGESDPRSMGIYSNLLLRTLVGYDHVAGIAGTKLVPDLAVAVPAPTDGGRTYTFRLKRGIRFGPPVDREIVAADIRYAIERLARPRNGAQYPYLYRVIRGFDDYRAGKARSIAGISTRGPKTIEFELTRPASDFLHRLTLAATAPIPPEVGKCFEGKPGRYGFDIVSSGPYMLEGMERLRLGSCRSLRPVPGNSLAGFHLVRNPRYDPRTDSTAARESNPDRFVFAVVHGHPAAAEVVRKLTGGELDDAILSSSPKVIGRYAAAARKRGRLRVESADWLFYLSLNVTRPPFDDVHVRRALSWLVDRAALREAWGGAEAGQIARHYIPDDLLGGRLRGYDPYATPGDRGSLARARAELAKSAYRTRHGLCIDGACKGVFLTSDCNADRICGDLMYAASQRMIQILGPLAAKLGIALRHGRRSGWDLRLPSSPIPISQSGYWRAQYPDASSFVDPVFSSAAIQPRHNPNTSLVGITQRQARPLGISGRFARVPSVDADIARCAAETGSRRLDCYAALDRKLSTDVVPWIPYLWRSRITILGPQVARWAFDRSSGTTSFAHVALRR